MQFRYITHQFVVLLGLLCARCSQVGLQRFNMQPQGGNAREREKLGSFLFASMDRYKDRSAAKKVPEWRIVSQGLNLLGICKNKTCEAFGQRACSWHGFETRDKGDLTAAKHVFYIGCELSLASCPVCSTQLRGVTTCVLVDCQYRYYGKTHDKVIHSGKGITPKEGYRIFEGDGSKNLTYWETLELSVHPRDYKLPEEKLSQVAEELSPEELAASLVENCDEESWDDFGEVLTSSPPQSPYLVSPQQTFPEAGPSPTLAELPPTTAQHSFSAKPVLSHKNDPVGPSASGGFHSDASDMEIVGSGELTSFPTSSSSCSGVSDMELIDSAELDDTSTSSDYFPDDSDMELIGGSENELASRHPNNSGGKKPIDRKIEDTLQISSN